VCPKLEALELDFAEHGLIDVNCIVVHSDTLYSLVVGTGESESKLHFSVTMEQGLTLAPWSSKGQPSDSSPSSQAMYKRVCCQYLGTQNSHRWPEYKYTLKQLTGTMGQKEVVAVPLRAARLEFPDNSALQYSM
jgi:hypothetical protein